MREIVIHTKENRGRFRMIHLASDFVDDDDICDSGVS